MVSKVCEGRLAVRLHYSVTLGIQESTNVMISDSSYSVFIVFFLSSYYMQEGCVGHSVEVVLPVEEEVKVKPTVLLRCSQDDYYGSLSNTCRNTQMDSLKVNTGSLDTRITHFPCLHKNPYNKTAFV